MANSISVNPPLSPWHFLVKNLKRTLQWEEYIFSSWFMGKNLKVCLPCPWREVICSYISNRTKKSDAVKAFVLKLFLFHDQSSTKCLRLSNFIPTSQLAWPAQFLGLLVTFMQNWGHKSAKFWIAQFVYEIFPDLVTRKIFRRSNTRAMTWWKTPRAFHRVDLGMPQEFHKARAC